MSNDPFPIKNTGPAAAGPTRFAGLAGDVTRPGYRPAGAPREAQGAAGTVGEQMTSLAGTIREKGPHTGMIGSAACGVAKTLERGGRYLQREGFRGLGEEMTNFIRHNPIPALLAGFGVGYLIARATRS